MLLINHIVPVAQLSRSTRMVVYQGSKKAGEAIYKSSLPAGGGRSTMLAVTFFPGTMGEVEFTDIEVVDALGCQISSKLVIRSKAGTEVTSAKMATDGTATVKITRQGSMTEKMVKPPKRSSRRDASEFWFSTSHPAIGAWLKCVRFSPVKFQWESMKTTFVGRKPVKIGGRMMTGNEVIQEVPGETDKYWLDDHGDPIVIDTGKTRFERK